MRPVHLNPVPLTCLVNDRSVAAYIINVHSPSELKELETDAAPTTKTTSYAELKNGMFDSCEETFSSRGKGYLSSPLGQVDKLEKTQERNGTDSIWRLETKVAEMEVSREDNSQSLSMALKQKDSKIGLLTQNIQQQESENMALEAKLEEVLPRPISSLG
ncbi:hypothetical protein OS493_038025 [Desmophyllum pertusum]|uniref:Uncharacterized protein n=1 Tax=Desmophyllum pertusum TaxID=174260 RepID=A0A9W9ZJ68_9CNID|nr:hypothetical protein OS493_038025 [Desmophyllum pertusum]